MTTVEIVKTRNIKVIVTQKTNFRSLLKTVAKFFLLDYRHYGFYDEKYSFISENMLVSDYYNLIKSGENHLPNFTFRES